MKKSLLLLLVIAVALSFGCGKKEEAQKADVAGKEEVKKTEKVFTPGEGRRVDRDSTNLKTSREAIRAVPIDEVTGEVITEDYIPYSYQYNGKTYFFKTEENLILFKQDPEKYIMKKK
jgi:YHS domain-containing protein